nr:hypothetical protein CFP56_40785 [Quercus suber]
MAGVDHDQIRILRNHLTGRYASFKDLFQGMFLYKRPNLAESFAYIAWSIWSNRNAQRVGNVLLPLSKIYNDSMEHLHEFHMACDPPLPSSLATNPVHWLPPLNPHSKVNFVSAVFQDLHLAGIRVVV